jgi:hypothetical protein
VGRQNCCGRVIAGGVCGRLVAARLQRLEMRIFPSDDDNDPTVWRPSSSLGDAIRLAVALLTVIVVGTPLGLCGDLEGSDPARASIGVAGMDSRRSA